MTKIEQIPTPFEDLMAYVLEHGEMRDDRTGTGALTIFGNPFPVRYDLSKGFPLLTTKKVPFRLVASELLWFLSGSHNIRPLLENNNHIWDEWPFKHWLLETGKISPKDAADSDKINALTDLKNEFTGQILSDDKFAEKWGNLGPVYGYQWRHWQDGRGGEIDQISRVLDQIKEKKNDRRMIVNAWNVADIDEMKISGLPPCHMVFQFDVSKDGKLSCQLYQRTCDVFLGVPFNIASYSLLTMMMAQQAGLEPGEFVWTGGNIHIYANHIEQSREQVERLAIDVKERGSARPYPTLKIKKAKDIFSYTMDDFVVENYDPWPTIKAPIAV